MTKLPHPTFHSSGLIVYVTGLLALPVLFKGGPASAQLTFFAPSWLRHVCLGGNSDFARSARR